MVQAMASSKFNCVATANGVLSGCFGSSGNKRWEATEKFNLPLSINAINSAKSQAETENLSADIANSFKCDFRYNNWYF